MTKTLYISDLDGTLLQHNAKLSDYTTQALRAFIRRGGLFSVATARTWESILHNHFLDPVLPLSVPIVLMNGALIVDTQTRRYVKKDLIEPNTAREMVACIKAHGIAGLLYSNPDDDIMRIYHGEITRHYMQRWYPYRKEIYRDHMVETDTPPLEHIVGVSVPDTHEALLPLYEALRQLPELNCYLYPCAYEADVWFFECFSCHASKYNAVQFLREAYGFEKIVGFGDNLNDLPLFKACDEGYAVANARDELKAVATGVIGANTEDGVAKFLEELLC